MSVCVWFAPAARGLRPSTLYPALQDAHGVAAETQRRSCFQPLLGASRRGQQVGWGWEEWVIFCFSPGVGWALQTAFQTPSLRGPRGRRPPGGRHSRHLPGLPWLPQHLVPQGKLVLEFMGEELEVALCSMRRSQTFLDPCQSFTEARWGCFHPHGGHPESSGHLQPWVTEARGTARRSPPARGAAASLIGGEVWVNP